MPLVTRWVYEGEREGEKGGGRQGAPPPSAPGTPLSQKDTGGHPADSLGELFWRSELPGQAGESQRRGPQVRRLGRGLPGDHFWSLLGPSVLSIPLVTSWISDDLGEHFWSLLAPSLLSIPLVTSWISVDLGEHFWSLLGPSVLSIPLVTS